MKSLESACVARPLCTHHIGTSALLIGPRAYTAIFAVGSRRTERSVAGDQ